MIEQQINEMKKAGNWRFFPMLVFAIMMLGGFVVMLVSLYQVAPEKWHDIGNPKRIAEGESTRQITQNLNQSFLLNKPFALIERSITWNLLRDAGDAVKPGCGDWFFLSDELTVYKNAKENSRVRAELAYEIGQRLQKKGIKLVLVMIPDKSRIEAQHLCHVYRPKRHDARLQDWINLGRKLNLNIFDLTMPMAMAGEEMFFRTDTHWNEAGAHRAAMELRDYLVLKRIVEPPAAPFNRDVVKSNRIERPGDLFRVANLEGLPANLRPPFERAIVSEVAAVKAQSDDLFGDTAVSAAIVGTSYSRTANFIPFFAHELGMQVANFAKDGGDFDGAMHAYLNGKTITSDPPKFIIWEIPERMLEKPLSENEKMWAKEFKVNLPEVLTPKHK